MSLTVGDIITGARRKLHDEDSSAYRWSDADLLAYAGQAQREVVKAKPDENPVRVSLQLIAGLTVQDILPAAGWQLLDIVRNMGSDGETPGPAIPYIERAELDRQDRKWHSSAPSSEVWNWTRDRTDNKKFYVYPRVHLSTPVYVEMVYSAIPALFLQTVDALVISDIHQTAMEFLTAGLALMEDDPKSDIPRGQALIKTGFDSLRLGAQSEMAVEAR
jgi:hypothetical protein